MTDMDHCCIDALRAEARRSIEQLECEKRNTEQLESALADVYESAVDYQSAYNRLIRSRAVKLWMKYRKLIGSPYSVCKKKIEEPEALSNRLNDDEKGMWGELDKELSSYSDTFVSRNSYYKKYELTIGLVADEFSWQYLCDSADFVYLSPDNYRDEIDSGRLDLVIVMGTWRGLGCFDGGSRAECAHYFGANGRKRQCRILEYARERGIKTAFYTIEDPPSYKLFLDIAKQADYIFTSAAECVESYKEDAPDSDVFVALYGVNPAMHNPIGIFRTFDMGQSVYSSSAIFAGAWYEEYQKRCRDTEMITKGIIDSPTSSLCIVDRNRSKGGLARLRFPLRFSEYCIPSIPHAALQAAHKLFGWTINLNSVTDSRTMCAMRVYEVQALGGLLLTNYSLSTATRFPGVFTVFDSGEVGRIVDGYSERELADMRVEGVRDMYSGCTVYDRLGEMLEACGLGTRPPVLPVYVVCAEGDAAARALFEAQECPGKVAVSPAEAASLEGPGYLVVADGADHGPFWLLDMVNAFKFCDPDYVRYSPEAEWRSSYEFCEGEATARGTLYDLSRVRAADVLSGAAAPGGRGFRVLEPAWGRDTSGIEKELAVVIAVRDDGEELWKRCFRSLLRSSAFARMRVYLVDGGSSDGRTPAIARWIAGRFDNVEAIFLEDGGAGWRSRAWNRGLEAAGEPYVTFLSADCEAVGDGYAKLLERAKEGACEIVVGGWRDVRGRMRDCVIWDPTPHREGEEPLIANCAPGIDSGIASASKEGAFGRIELGLGDINPGIGIYSRALFDGCDREIGVGLIRSLVDNGAYGYVPSLVITAYSRELRSDDPSLGLPFLRQELRDAKNKMAGALSSGDDAPFANGRELPFDEDRLSRWKAALMDLSPDDRKEALPILEELLACYSVD